MEGLTHFDEKGNAIMVDVTHKPVTERMAVATGRIKVNEQVLEAIQKGTIQKGDVLGVARIAGIMAAKKTPDMIPLCHPLLLTQVTIDFKIQAEERIIEVFCTTRLSGVTGVEMEALTGATVALLTIYDMCKALDRNMVIDNICLVEKHGGKNEPAKVDS